MSHFLELNNRLTCSRTRRRQPGSSDQWSSDGCGGHDDDAVRDVEGRLVGVRFDPVFGLVGQVVPAHLDEVGAAAGDAGEEALGIAGEFRPLHGGDGVLGVLGGGAEEGGHGGDGVKKEIHCFLGFVPKGRETDDEEFGL